MTAYKIFLQKESCFKITKDIDWKGQISKYGIVQLEARYIMWNTFPTNTAR